MNTSNLHVALETPGLLWDRKLSVVKSKKAKLKKQVCGSD